MQFIKIIIMLITITVTDAMNMIQTRGFSRYRNSLLLNLNQQFMNCPLLAHLDNRQKRADEIKITNNNNAVFEDVILEMLTQEGEVPIVD